MQTSPFGGQIFLLFLLLATFSCFLFLLSHTETHTVVNITGQFFSKNVLFLPHFLCRSFLYPLPASARPAPVSSLHLPEHRAARANGPQQVSEQPVLPGTCTPVATCLRISDSTSLLCSSFSISMSCLWLKLFCSLRLCQKSETEKRRSFVGGHYCHSDHFRWMISKQLYRVCVGVRTPVKFLWAASRSGRKADFSITKPGDSNCGSQQGVPHRFLSTFPTPWTEFLLLHLSDCPPLAFVRIPPLPSQQVPLLTKNITIIFGKGKTHVAPSAVLCYLLRVLVDKKGGRASVLLTGIFWERSQSVSI